MHVTFVKPTLGCLDIGERFVDEARMEPLSLGLLAGLTPPGVDCRLWDDRIDEIDYDEPTDLVAINVEIFTARRAYEIADEYRARKVQVVMGGRLQSGAGDAAGALKGLDEGIQKLGDTPSLVLPALEYERQLGAYDAALKRLDSVQKYLPPESAMALRGEILAQAGRSGEAREVFGDASTSLSNRTDHARRPAEETAALEARLRAGLKQINTQSPPSGLKK